MSFVIVALTLFAFLTIADADAETDAEQLAKKFSSILVLTEDTGGKWGDIEVLKPEPVEIMGAQSAENIWFSSRDLNDKENPPPLTGPEEATVAEHSTDAIGPYEADDPDDDALTWSLSGADAAAFELTGTGLTRSLAFKTPPDFEQQASYTLTVGVSDAEPLSATVTTTVSVSNVDEAGTLMDSVATKEIPTPRYIENGGLRLLTKVVAGTVSGIAFTGMSMIVQDKIWEPRGDPDADAYRTLSFFLIGGTVGCGVGFPLGVSEVDPYDSWPVTLLAGIIPGLAGISLLAGEQSEGTAFLFMYVVPVVNSLIASELWRKRPQDRRVSFALAPTLNGSLSAATILRLAF